MVRLPCGSPSIRRTFFPDCARPIPRLAQVVVLPTLCEASHNVGKTVSCVNLGIGLAQEGRKDDLRKEYSTADVTNRHYQGGFPQTVRRECVGGRGIR